MRNKSGGETEAKRNVLLARFMLHLQLIISSSIKLEHVSLDSKTEEKLEILVKYAIEENTIEPYNFIARIVFILRHILISIESVTLQWSNNILDFSFNCMDVNFTWTLLLLDILIRSV